MSNKKRAPRHWWRKCPLLNGKLLDDGNVNSRGAFPAFLYVERH